MLTLSRIIEKWDQLIYWCYNVCAILLYWMRYASIHDNIKKNKQLKNKHKGQRCIIVLNGPSAQKHDLSKLKDEYVFCVNSIFRSEDIVRLINPDYYCWNDSAIFKSDEGKAIIEELFKKCPQSNFIFNYQYRNISDKAPDNVYLAYCKHMPTYLKVRCNLSSICSNFTTVAFFAINVAIYMGFSSIYILGLDFSPTGFVGGFKHGFDLGDDSAGNSVCDKKTLINLYWCYTKAQYESYYLLKEAEKRGAKIINTNPDSYIRTFEFGNYEDLF